MKRHLPDNYLRPKLIDHGWAFLAHHFSSPELDHALLAGYEPFGTDPGGTVFLRRKLEDTCCMCGATKGACRCRECVACGQVKLSVPAVSLFRPDIDMGLCTQCLFYAKEELTHWRRCSGCGTAVRVSIKSVFDDKTAPVNCIDCQ